MWSEQFRIGIPPAFPIGDDAAVDAATLPRVLPTWQDRFGLMALAEVQRWLYGWRIAFRGGGCE